MEKAIEKGSFISELLSYILGGMSPAYMTGALMFIAFGAGIMMYVNVLHRDRDSDNTPYRFSWRFWAKDNWWRPLANVFISFIVVRFFREFTGMEINMFFCLIIGLSFDYVIILLRESVFAVRKGMGMKIDKFREQNKFEKLEI